MCSEEQSKAQFKQKKWIIVVQKLEAKHLLHHLPTVTLWSSTWILWSDGVRSHTLCSTALPYSCPTAPATPWRKFPRPHFLHSLVHSAVTQLWWNTFTRPIIDYLFTFSSSQFHVHVNPFSVLPVKSLFCETFCSILAWYYIFSASSQSFWPTIPVSIT